MSTRELSRAYRVPVREHETLGDAFWASILGGVGGGLGAALMLVTTQRILGLEHSPLDVARLSARFLHRLTPALGITEPVGVVGAVVLGILLGSALGRLTWRPRRVLPRLLFCSIVAPAAWLFAQSFVIGHFSRAEAGALPLAPFLCGAALYGVCVAVLVSLRRRDGRKAARALLG